MPATIFIPYVVKVHWVYYFPFSFGVTFFIGLIASLFIDGAPADPALTFWGKSKLKELG